MAENLFSPASKLDKNAKIKMENDKLKCQNFLILSRLARNENESLLPFSPSDDATRGFNTSYIVILIFDF